MPLKILQPDEIKNPRVQAVVEETNEKDWILGAEQGSTFVKETLFPDRDCTPYITEYNDLQRNNFFDEFCCVVHGTINAVQLIIKKKYGITLDFSKRDLANRIPVTPGQGTSIRSCAECLRTQGVALEKDYPTLTPTMTQTEFFTKLQGVKEFLLENGFIFNHINLPSTWLGATMDKIIDDGLLSSPVIVAIEGSYRFDAEGRLQYQGNPYTHVVLIVKSSPNGFPVLDSENPQGLMNVRRDYAFSSPKIISITRLTPMNARYKIKGNNAVFQVDPVENKMVPYASGRLYKTMQGTVDYQGVVEVENLAALEAIAPLSDWIMAELPWDKSSFINSLS
jgi:hypothetical protein